MYVLMMHHLLLRFAKKECLFFSEFQRLLRNRDLQEKLRSSMVNFKVAVLGGFSSQL